MNSCLILHTQIALYLHHLDKEKAKGKKEKQAISYAAERVIGNGSFGVVYQATVIESGETVAIKKVLQDRRFKVCSTLHTHTHPIACDGVVRSES